MYATNSGRQTAETPMSHPRHWPKAFRPRQLHRLCAPVNCDEYADQGVWGIRKVISV